MQKMKGLYIHIPKTGGTFLRAYFMSAAPQIIQVGHNCISEIEFDLKDYYTFAFIRNPFDWYVSRYFYFKRIDAVEQGVSICCDSGLAKVAFAKAFPTFRDHMLWGINNPENFWLSNRYINMCTICGEDRINKFYYFESMQDNINLLFSDLQISPNILYVEYYEGIGKISLNSTEHEHYSHYYDDELIALVEGKDSYLLDRFGYSYGIR